MEEVPEALISASDAVSMLSSGLTDMYSEDLSGVKRQLIELTKKQEIICTELHLENLKLSEGQCNPDLHDMFSKIIVYRKKLIVIKNQMTTLHEKSNKLKRRVLKLEQNKQYEAKQRAQQREKEEQLIGKHPS